MKLLWKQPLGEPNCPYLIRWVLDLGWFSLRLHHWIASDDQRHYHDHPWWYLTLCLWGGYTDVSPQGEKRVDAKHRCHSFPANHQHTVRVDKGGCWTLLVTGPENREWGFWVDGKFRKRNKYFFEHGHHPCEKSS